jgi:branched-chain amino acid transport system ATP-binding protein
MNLLEVEGLTKSYGGVHAARGVSFSLKKGELLALIGPNGAGKSTTFGMVGGQLVPDSGKVEIEGVDITGLPPREIAKHGVGRTFQVATIFSSMTVIENIQTTIAAHRCRDFASIPDGRQLFRDEAMDVLSLTNMTEFADRPCAALSYGDIKRAELAIALAGNARLLLMDEPTAGMAPVERARLMDLVASLASERNMGVLFTEHDMDSVFKHADRIIVLVRGQIIAEGHPDDVRENEQVKRFYLGEIGATAAQRARMTR